MQGNMLPPFPGGGWAGGRRGLIIQVAWVLSMPLSSPLRAVPALPHHCIWGHVSAGWGSFLVLGSCTGQGWHGVWDGLPGLSSVPS